MTSGSLSSSRIVAPLRAGTLLEVTAISSIYSLIIPMSVSFSSGLSCPKLASPGLLWKPPLESLRRYQLCRFALVVSLRPFSCPSRSVSACRFLRHRVHKLHHALPIVIVDGVNRRNDCATLDIHASRVTFDSLHWSGVPGHYHYASLVLRYPPLASDNNE